MTSDHLIPPSIHSQRILILYVCNRYQIQVPGHIYMHALLLEDGSLGVSLEQACRVIVYNSFQNK